MNLYSNKQRWKIFLLLIAMIIVGITLWYSNFIASKIDAEERHQIELWSEGVQRQADLVEFTRVLFDSLKVQERKQADLLVKAFNIIGDPEDKNDLTFVTNYIWSNTTIPVMVFDETGEFQLSKNLPVGRDSDPSFIDSLKNAMAEKNPPIIFKDVNQYVYYDDSYLFTELQEVLNDLINSFISETVINSASVPVVLTDSSRTTVIRYNNVDSTLVQNSLESQLASMANENEPIKVDIPNQGAHYIYYEDSFLLKQLKYFPYVQLILIGAFLLVAYLIFSTFRKAEQNQVWVGMAKETAHQLGTPLSSLMAWMSILESQGVDKSSLEEINKDVKRLEMITNRFSKIGSQPELIRENMAEVINSAFGYLRHRTSSRVDFHWAEIDESLFTCMSRPLFGWVLENLVKNAIDAMEGEGNLTVAVLKEGNQVAVDITDDGKGISKRRQTTVFQPGFTTKKRGWGLGLSLTKRIIETYHKGKIYVSWSEPDKGTTFRILLPLDEPSSD
jgi:signal transduction histidine kinase